MKMILQSRKLSGIPRSIQWAITRWLLPKHLIAMSLQSLIFLTFTSSLNLVQMKHMKKRNCIVCQDYSEYGPNGANEDFFLLYNWSRSFWRAIILSKLVKSFKWITPLQASEVQILCYTYSARSLFEMKQVRRLTCSDAQELSVKLSTVSLNVMRAPGAFVVNVVHI